ncbi:MAG: D-alanine--D-alanine ligase family protein [Acidimicrobiia bacterium]
MAGRIRVLLLFGGRSAEHDVSRVSAASVARALDPARYEVIPVGITTDGRWLLARDGRALLTAGDGPLELPVAGDVVTVDSGRPGSLGESLAADVVVPLLHGPYGEDGTVQGLLELSGLPYVGSGVVGSAVGMDKVMMKRAFASAGLAQARHVEFRDGHDAAEFARRVADELGFPCFVKPANMGSSVGVSKAHDTAELDAAIALAVAYDEWIVVEEGVTAREIEVGILGDDPPRASVPGEIVPGAEFYSYADKYLDGTAELRAPAPLTDAQTAEAQALAVRAFEACRCEAMARVDFLFEEGGRGFLVNEVNTIPGFTPISMYPKLWELSGVSYAALLDELIALAFARHERRRARAGRAR